MKACVLTLGCKVNSYESDYLKQQLKKKSYEIVDIKENPDVIIVNTCSVTNKSDAKSRHLINKAKRNNEDALIVAIGCSVQNNKEDYINLGVDILEGTFGKSNVIKYIDDYFNKQEIKNVLTEKSSCFEDMFLDEKTDKTRAFVKIQDGCNNYCSYCIIPYLRGNIRSKDINKAYEEIKSLVKSGYKEIVLTGIHTGSYGTGSDYDLVDLIKKISTLEELKRIRISSIEITELNDKFLEELKTNKKIVNHMHIPLQSGSDLILKKMNRKYDTKYFKEKIKQIRSIRSGISITTDLIVGFPYETDEEFGKTLKFLKQIKFTKIHAFPFSLRNGTKAESMADGFIDEKVKKERMKKVLDISNKYEKEYYQKFIGKTLDVLVENDSCGHTNNYILVHLDKTLPKGSYVNVLITEVNEKCLGKVLDNK